MKWPASSFAFVIILMMAIMYTAVQAAAVGHAAKKPWNGRGYLDYKCDGCITKFLNDAKKSVKDYFSKLFSK